MAFSFSGWSLRPSVCNDCLRANSNRCVGMCQQAFVYDTSVDVMDRLNCLIEQFNVKGLRENPEKKDFILALPTDVGLLVGRLEA